MAVFLYGVLILSAFAFSLVHFVVGLMGLEQEFGLVWAIIAFILAVPFRFTLPITVGAYFGAIHVFGWEPLYAILFAAPGLALMVPGVIVTLFSFMFSMKRPS